MRRCFEKILMKAAAVFSAAVMMISSAGCCAYAKKTQKYTAKDFVHADGTKLIGADGKEFHIKGIAFGNNVWANPSVPAVSHHDEKAYKELAGMGFNCVRFYLNYGIFESDKNPYHYKKTGFDWIDKNIKWAKKYGIKLILNMHVPQGGYQSNGGGTELWSNKSNGDRLTELWKAIAKRYADEPAVIGYGLVNEPVVTMLETPEKTFEQYNSLMKRIAKNIRTVAPYQMMFIEGIGAAVKEDGERVYDLFSLENCFARINDKNIVYEVHDYDPFFFTHQNTEWAGTVGRTMEYPSEEVASEDVKVGWVDCVTAKKVSSKQNGWNYFESGVVSRSERSNIVQPAVVASYLGENGTAYFDDIEFTEISPNGRHKVLFCTDFTGGVFDSGVWSSDGSGISEYCADEGFKEKGCLKISGTEAMFVQNFKRFEMKKGYKYTISGYIKSDLDTPEIKMDLSLSENVYCFDKDYLEAGIKKFVKFSEDKNAPVFLGEFGVISETFEQGRNGIGWVRDMIGLCEKYGIGFNYHDFNEYSFGLYDNYPNGKNKELAALFKKILKKKQ